MPVWEGQATALCLAAPVWEAVRRRQAQLELTDAQMCDWLGWHPSVVDARPDALMPKTTAERLLRGLLRPVQPSLRGAA